MNYTEIIGKIIGEIKNLENKKKEIYDDLQKEKDICNKQLLYKQIHVINLNIKDLREQMSYLIDNW